MRAIFGGVDAGAKRLRRENWMTNQNTNCNARNQWIPGAFLIAVGTVILLDHMGVIHGEYYWRFWPLLLIAVGIIKFLNEGKRVGGMMLVLVGIFFMLQNMGYRLFSWANFWPFLIIGAGIAMIWGRFDRHHYIPSAAESSEESVQAFALFGGIEKRVHTSNLKGGQVTAMFGGVELDFRSAEIAGEEATVYVEAVFGGIEIVVPDRWTVVWQGENVFGGYSDQTRPPLPDVPGAAPRKRLNLKGRAVFGGVEVKN